MPAFQPYWGKPAVRNDREDRGNVGIIRSPVRASIPPDRPGLNNPQGASLTLGADLQGLQLPCVTLLPTSPASLKSRTIGSLAQASTALLRAPRLMATGAMVIFMPCRQRFERARDRRSTFSSDILARHCQATKNSQRLSLLAGLRPLHQFGTYPPAPMSHFPENYSRTLEVHSVDSQNPIRRHYQRSTKAAR